MLEEQWMLRTNIQGKSTDTAFLVCFQFQFVANQVELYQEDGT